MKGFYVSAYEHLKEQMLAEPKVWLVTGVAGFIGSNLLETLLRQNQRVIGLDNYATGSRRNLEQVQELVGPERWNNFGGSTGTFGTSTPASRRAKVWITCFTRQPWVQCRAQLKPPKTRTRATSPAS